MTEPNKANPTPPADDEALQGEGNYDATRRYDKAAREFAQSGQVDGAARAARPTSTEEAEVLRRAESEGKSHSKGEDPALKSDTRKPGR